MYCPVCSTKFTVAQKFCRACGFGLEKVVQSVGEQFPAKLDEDLIERKNRYERWGVAALSIFGTGVLGFLLFMFGYKLMLSKGIVLAALAVLGLFIVLGSGLLSVILFAKAKEVHEKSSKYRPHQMSENSAGDNLLTERYLEPLPSISESTTDLLVSRRPNDTEKA
jgi:hypothetical protein